MNQKIKKYFIQNRKKLLRYFIMAILFLFSSWIFYQNAKMTTGLSRDYIRDEKENHLNETCKTISEVDKQADFFLEKIKEVEKNRKAPDKYQKKELIVELRKMEGKLNSLEIAYGEFYHFDLSLKFLSFGNNTQADKLFSQIKNLPIYGYRAVDSLEALLQDNYPIRSKIEISEIEFSELKAKIDSTIGKENPICQR